MEAFPKPKIERRGMAGAGGVEVVQDPPSGRTGFATARRPRSHRKLMRIHELR